MPLTFGASGLPAGGSYSDVILYENLATDTWSTGAFTHTAGLQQRNGPFTDGPQTIDEAYPVTTIPAGLQANSTFTITFWASDGTTKQTESVPIVIKSSCARRYWMPATPRCPAPGTRRGTPCAGLGARAYMTASCPPSMTIPAPVMKDASSEARNAYTAATSDDRPRRPSGMLPLAYASANSCPPRSALMAAFSGVSMYPGHRALTRMPCGPSSTAMVLVSSSTPPLDAL